jgi:hypothetical protein
MGICRVRPIYHPVLWYQLPLIVRNLLIGLVVILIPKHVVSVGQVWYQFQPSGLAGQPAAQSTTAHSLAAELPKQPMSKGVPCPLYPIK